MTRFTENTVEEETGDVQGLQSRDKYWIRIKYLIGFFAGWTILTFFVWSVQVPTNVEGSEVGFNNYPLVNTTMIVFTLVLLIFPPLTFYFISKDKGMVSREYEDITNRHWLTVGLFSVFSYGIYPLWYLYARHKKIDSRESESVDSRSVKGYTRFIWGKLRRFQPTHLDILRNKGTELQHPLISWNSTLDTDERSNPGDLQKRVEQLVTNADNFRHDGEYEKAIVVYEKAITECENIKQRSSQDSNLVATIENRLTEISEKLQETEEKYNQYEHLRKPLQDAESSFQTAITEHVHNQRIPARRDYRQAADQYKQALSALDKSDYSIFEEEDNATVSVNLEAEYLPQKLSGWDSLSEYEREALSDAGIGTLDDIRNASEEMIRELVDKKSINENLANRLRAAKWWHGQDKRIFTSRATIERRRERAEQGRQILS